MSKMKARKGSPSSLATSSVQVKGRISFFGGPSDASTKTGGVENKTASGQPTSVPGIAIYNHATLGGWWKVTTPNGRTHIIQQTDIGPAPYTGRVIDFTYSALHLFGYSQSNFPTDSTAHAVYLGKSKQAAEEAGGANAVGNAEAGVTGVTTAPSGEGKAQDAGLLQDGETILSILKDILTGNIGDLGSKLALAGLAMTKNFVVGFADLIIAPAWHWNQRAAAYYTGYVIDPRRVGDGTEYQYAFAWTAAFWALGYVLLWTEQDGGLRAVPVHKTRFARHVRRVQALPARRALIAPGKVKEHTPTKPKPVVSSAYIVQTGSMSTTRTRRVKVHGSSRESVTQSAVPIEREQQDNGSPAKPDTPDTGRQGAHGDKRPDPADATAASKHPRDRT